MKLRSAEHCIDINIKSHAQLMQELRSKLKARCGFSLATVNLDHLVKISTDDDFARAYQRQDFVVADGRPITWLSRLSGDPVDLLPGSDLVRPVCQLAADMGVRVGLVGSHSKALADARSVLTTEFPGLDIALCIPPSQQFSPLGKEARTILKTLDEEGIQICFLALGAPKQEVFAIEGRKLAPSVGFVSVGAGLDFLGGHQVRAPMWMRKIAMEWLWRAMSSPRRLIPRYLKCFAILPGHVVSALRTRFTAY